MKVEDDFFGPRVTRGINNKAISAYDPDTNTIQIVTSDLTSCLTTECIESLLLHELGHSCQFNQFYVSKNSVLSSLASMQGKMKLESGILRTGDSGFDKAFDPATSDCIKNQVSAASEKMGRIKGIEMTEAFAEAVFASERRTVFHWAESCFVQDSTHLNPLKTYLKCLIHP